MILTEILLVRLNPYVKHVEKLVYHGLVYMEHCQGKEIILMDMFLNSKKIICNLENFYYLCTQEL